MRRRFEFELEQLRRRIHILQGFKIIFNALDRALKLIRESDGKADAAEKLMKAARQGFDFNEGKLRKEALKEEKDKDKDKDDKIEEKKVEKKSKKKKDAESVHGDDRKSTKG